MQWSVPVGVFADAAIFVARVYEELGNIKQAQLRSEVERCVAIVGEIRIL